MPATRAHQGVRHRHRTGQLARLRAAGIAHGDLGLASVLLDEDGKAWLVDFDLAQAGASDRLLDHDVATLWAALERVAEPALVRAAAEQAVGPDAAGGSPKVPVATAGT